MVNYGEKAPEIIFISAVIPPLQKYKFKPPEAVKVAIFFKKNIK